MLLKIPRNVEEAGPPESRASATAASCSDAQFGIRWMPSSPQLLAPVTDGAKAFVFLTGPNLIWDGFVTLLQHPHHFPLDPGSGLIVGIVKVG